MANKKTPRIAKKLGGFFINSVAFFVQLLPSKVADNFGVFIGFLIRVLLGKQRRQARSNLRMCYPEWTDSQINETSKKMFRHFGKTGIRFLRGSKLTPSEIDKMTNSSKVESILNELRSGSCGIVVSAHFGNWEHLSQFLVLKGVPFDVVVRDLDDELTDSKVVQLRTRHGLGLISRGDAGRKILRALRNNRTIGILVDQNTKAGFANFFGYPAGTVNTPAVFHLKLGCPIHVIVCTETIDGNYEVEGKTIVIQNLSGEFEADSQKITQEINNVLEEFIRKKPEQWLWMHDRWRSAKQAGLISN